MKTSHLLGILVVCILIAAGLYAILPKNRPAGTVSNTPPQTAVPPQDIVPQQATLEGVYLCLPHKNAEGPQTMECALGMKTDDGSYYALDMNALAPGQADAFQVNSRIKVEGLITPIEMLSSDHYQNYPIKGIMSVSRVLQ